ncbi:MAG: acyloxyacyl hydrolase [Bacteroidota bacterium]
MLSKRNSILLLLLLQLQVSFAQHKLSDYTWGLEGRYKMGFLIAHRAIMGHVPNGPTHAGEISLLIRMNGSKSWHYATSFPTLGVTVFAGTVGNSQLLGNFFGANAFIDFPIIRAKFYQFSGKMACGLGYGSKIYDPITNPKDVAISTHLNAMIQLGIKSSFTIEKNTLSLALDMTHFSNGAFKTPNLGINLPYVSVGFERIINTAAPLRFTTADAVTPWKKWLFNITAIGSVKEVFPTGGRKYPVFALNTSARWMAKPKVGMEHGIDFILKQSIMDYHIEAEKNQWDILQIGLYSAYLLPLDQFHFVFGMGVYVKDKYSPEDIFYHRVGMRYYLKNGININLSLKSHWAKADYVEWGVGYSFRYRKK